MPIYNIDKEKNKRLHSYRVIVSYTDDFGKHRKKEKVIHNALLKDANKLEAQMQLELENSENYMQDITYESFLNKYLDAKKLNIRIATYQSDYQKFKNHILPYFSKLKLKAITPDVINHFKKDLNDKKNIKTGLPLNDRYKKNILKLLSSTLNYAAKYRYINYNPISITGSSFGATDYKLQYELHYITLDQFNVFSQYLKTEADKSNSYQMWSAYVFFNILFYCGLRKSEAYALRWTSIKDNKIQVRSGIIQKIKGIPYFEGPTKNKSSVRDIPICNVLKIILDEHKERSKSLIGFNDDYFIIGGISPLSDSFLSKLKIKGLTSCNIPNIRIHDFRHSFASLLINQGVNIKVISKLMGHSTVEQTWNRYSHLYPEKENEAIKKIDELTKIN